MGASLSTPVTVSLRGAISDEHAEIASDRSPLLKAQGYKAVFRLQSWQRLRR